MQNIIFKAIALASTKHPKKTLGVLLLFTVLMAWSMSTLRLEMNQMSLLPDDDPVSKQYNHIIKAFDGGIEQITIAVRGANEQVLGEVAQEVNAILQPMIASGDLRRVQYAVPREYVKNHGFMLNEHDDLEKLLPQTQNLNLIPFLTAFNDNLERTFVGGQDKMVGAKENNAVASLESIDKLLAAVQMSMDTIPQQALHEKINQAVHDFWLGDEYMYSADRNLLVMYAQTSVSLMDSVFKVVKVVEQVDSLVHIVEQKYAGQGVKIGLTGMPAIQKDEMNASMDDSAISTVLAFGFILLMLMYSFRLWLAPFFAGMALLIGIVWAGGIAGITVGRLNVSTIFFGVYLVGLGIDFCIHLLHGYNEHKSLGATPEQAVYKALETNGGGILTGGITTSFAFLALVLTDFAMYREMGLIAGLGILACMASALLLLPSMLIILDNYRIQKGTYRAPTTTASHSALIGSWAYGVAKYRKAGMALFILALGYSVFQIPHIGFNSNMMDLEPDGLESVELQDTLLKAFDQSVENVLFTVPSLDSAWAVYTLFRENRLVGGIESPALICPPPKEQQKRIPVLLAIRENLKTPVAEQPVLLGDFTAQLERLQANIIEMSQSAFMSQQDKIVKRADRITGLDSAGNMVQGGRFGGIFAAIDSAAQSAEATQKLETILRSVQTEFKKVSEQLLYSMSNPQTITWDSVPQQFQMQFQSKDKQEYLVSIYPKNDVWDNVTDSPFLKSIEREIPHATGMIALMKVIYVRAGEEGRFAVMLSLIAIALLMLLHFRHNLLLAVLAMVPMVSSVIILIGIYVTFDIQFNIASIMGVPMIIGIGVDDGIHVCHRFAMEKTHSIQMLLSRVGHAVLLTTLTTGIAFGSLMFGTMKSNVSLGVVLFAGVMLCYFISISVLPMAFGFMKRQEQ
jgi:uncharacterized protein